MKLVIITGSYAVGKMTVAQELEKITLRCQEPPVLFYPPSVFRCF